MIFLLFIMIMLVQVQIFILISIVVSYNLDLNHVLVYKFPGVKSRLAYFGMSVSVRPKASIFSNSWVLQIGAPRSNLSTSKFNEPGTVYRCSIYGPCSILPLDDNKYGVKGKGKYTYIDKFDEALVGVTMDIRENGGNEETVVCGHRWANEYRKNADFVDVTYLMVGVCYLQNICNCSMPMASFKLLPLLDQEHIYTPTPWVPGRSVYNWGLGQAGISAQLMEDSSSVLIGAPGVYHWTGSVIKYGINTTNLIGDFAFTDPIRGTSYTYVGYQVSSGRFFGDKKLWYVTSAPRAANYHGQVLIFQFQGESKSSVYIASNITGSTFGEYFGAALTVCDINNDGHDDLVVGSPTYSFREPDEGRIYVFLGTNRDSLLVQSQIINGEVSLARFGTCVSSIGDLDQDGYQDVAVGAPYESNNRGAVYIYRGSLKGLLMTYSQRILAEDIDHTLRGFGISISKGIDIDGNLYRDLAIGAYLSDDVVLLRSRPIISLHPSIELAPFLLLDRRALSVNITVCSKYSGTNVPKGINITRIIEVDPIYRRGKLRSTGSADNRKVVYLNLNEKSCENHLIILNPTSTNESYGSPIEISLTNELSKCSDNSKNIIYIRNKGHDGKDKFSKWCPLEAKKEVAAKIPFAGECGSDNICESDLDFSCSFVEISKSIYIIGMTDHLTLSLKIRNNLEPAQNTKLTVFSNVKLIQDEYEQWNINESMIASLDVDDSYLRDNSQREFFIQINTEPEKLKELAGNRLNIHSVVHTNGPDNTIDKYICNVTLKLVCNNIVHLYSSTSTSSFSVSDETNQQINFTHYYEIRKTGETPINDGELVIFLPTFYYDEISIQVITSEIENSESMYRLAPQYEVTKIGDERDLNLDKNSFLANDGPPNDRTFFFNCTSLKVQCKTIDFTFPDGMPVGTSAVVKIFLSFNFSAINEYMGDKDIVYFTSNAILKIPEQFDMDSVILHSNASMSIFKDKEAKSVEPYVVGVSVLGGGLLLSLIISGLFKSDFFRRKKKEELKALKAAEEQSGFEICEEISTELQ